MIRLGITMGDPSGIGPEIIAKALAQVEDLADITVIGDRRIFNISSPTARRISTVKFVDLDNVSRSNFRFGRVACGYGKASIEYLECALRMIKQGLLDCLVTAPVSKEAISRSGCRLTGHTEYLARHTQTKDYAMMLLNGKLRFGLVSRHIPIKKVSHAVNKQELLKAAKLSYLALKELFSLAHPRLIACGLNPHASDNGLLGEEENKIIKPALLKLRKSGIPIEGPKPADVAIMQMNQGSYDCAIAMYHDQALIALKMFNPERGVNLTAGLPFVRTSPLHGTAFDIAGKNLAKPDSLIEAIKLAVKCALNQRRA